MGKKNTEICFDQQLVLQLLMPQDGDWHNMTSSYILQSAIFDSRHEFKFVFFFHDHGQKKKHDNYDPYVVASKAGTLQGGMSESRGDRRSLDVFF